MTAMRLKRYPSPSGGIALGKMGVGATLMSAAKTARDYVQDGLIAMWDGIENAGWGTHDANATVWKDLVGGLGDLTLSGGYAILGAGVDFDGISGIATGPKLGPNSGYSGIHIEFCLTPKSAGRFGGCGFTLAGAYQYRPSILVDSNLFVTALITGETYNTGIVPCTRNSMTISAGGSNGSFLTALNGEIKANFTDSNQHFDKSINYFRVGGYGSAENTVGRYEAEIGHCIRLYSRALTASEIAANYAIDKERFNLP